MSLACSMQELLAVVLARDLRNSERAIIGTNSDIQLAAYVEAATPETFPAYLQRYVLAPTRHADYLDAVGGARLAALNAREGPAV